MKVSFEGFMRNISRGGINPVVQEFIDNLRELRNDPAKHGEFFALYVFRDDDKWRSAQAAEVRPATPQQAQPAICRNALVKYSASRRRESGDGGCHSPKR